MPRYDLLDEEELERGAALAARVFGIDRDRPDTFGATYEHELTNLLAIATTCSILRRSRLRSTTCAPCRSCATRCFPVRPTR